MALEVTQVHRNLHQRVTWLYLEIEDMFLVLGLGVLANFVGRVTGREIHGIPLSFLLMWIVPLLAIPCLWLFKYGKPRGYLRDLLIWQIKPHLYCGLERDSELTKEYLR